MTELQKDVAVVAVLKEMFVLANVGMLECAVNFYFGLQLRGIESK